MRIASIFCTKEYLKLGRIVQKLRSLGKDLKFSKGIANKVTSRINSLQNYCWEWKTEDHCVEG